MCIANEKPKVIMTKMSSFILLSCLVLFHAQSMAIGINSMLQYTNEDGESEFSIANTEDYRQYVNVAISEVYIENGEIKKIPYSRDNLSEWALEVSPARAILEPGFNKVFSVKYQPKLGVADRARERVFQISFVPTPYFSEGEKKENAVKMAFGFSPLVIVPATPTPPIQYDIRYSGDKVVVTNKGEGFFTLYLDACPKSTPTDTREKCSTYSTVLAGRKLDVALSKEMAASVTLNAKLTSYKNKFKVETVIKKQS